MRNASFRMRKKCQTSPFAPSPPGRWPPSVTGGQTTASPVFLRLGKQGLPQGEKRRCMFRMALSLPGSERGLLSLTENEEEGETLKSSRFLPWLPFHCVALNTWPHLARPQFAHSEDAWREQLPGSAHAENSSPISGN